MTLPDVDLVLNAWSPDSLAGLAVGQLRLPYCAACERHWDSAALYCPIDLHHAIVGRAVSGHGQLWSWVTYRRDYGLGDRIPVPYTVCVVTLDAGPRMQGLLLAPVSDRYRWRARVEFEIASLAGQPVPAFALVSSPNDSGDRPQIDPGDSDRD